MAEGGAETERRIRRGGRQRTTARLYSVRLPEEGVVALAEVAASLDRPPAVLLREFVMRGLEEARPRTGDPVAVAREARQRIEGQVAALIALVEQLDRRTSVRS